MPLIVSDHRDVDEDVVTRVEMESWGSLDHQMDDLGRQEYARAKREKRSINFPMSTCGMSDGLDCVMREMEKKKNILDLFYTA